MEQLSDNRATSSQEVDRRQSERRPFTATSEIIETRSRERISGRVADIARSGCYVDVINPFPAGTAVRLEINHGNKKFQAQGTVVFSLERMGMGITFGAVSADQLAVLEEWLGVRHGDAPAAQVRPSAAPIDHVQRDVLLRLINLLLRQRTITATQAEDLLNDLMREI
jgi:hypothetical protein